MRYLLEPTIQLALVLAAFAAWAMIVRRLEQPR